MKSEIERLLKDCSDWGTNILGLIMGVVMLCSPVYFLCELYRVGWSLLLGIMLIGSWSPCIPGWFLTRAAVKRLRDYPVLKRMSQVAVVLPWTKELMAVDLSSAKLIRSRLNKRFSKRFVKLIDESTPDTDAQREALMKCDVDTQGRCIDFLCQLVMDPNLSNNYRIKVEHWRKLEEYFREINPYLEGYIQQYYGPLVEGCHEKYTFVSDYLFVRDKLRELRVFFLDTAETARKELRNLLVKYYAESPTNGQVFRLSELEKKMDAYCAMFGLSHCRKSVVMDNKGVILIKNKKVSRNARILIFCSFVSPLSPVLFDRGKYLLGAICLLPVLLYLAHIIYSGLWQKWFNVSILEEDLYVKKRELLLADRENVLLLIAYACQMNPDAKQNQLKILKEFYSDQIECYLERKVSYSEAYEKISKCSGLKYEKRRDLVDLLFRLAVEDDGIKNDEWYFLKSILSAWRFSDTFVSYYVNRYGSLRTEFDEQSDNFSGNSSQSSTSCYLGNYYRTLGLEESASDEEVKRAYHALALQHHPDLPKNTGRKVECEALMAKINEAYEKICG